MKTLKISSLAAIVACLTLFAACTKDTLEAKAPTSTSAASSADYLSAAAKKDNPATETGMNQMQNQSGNGAEKATANVTELELKANPAKVGSTVYLTAKVAFTNPISNTQVHIQKSVTKDANGIWQDWVAVDDYNGTINFNGKDKTFINSYDVNYSFTAKEAGKSAWRVRVNGGDVEKSFSEEVELTVTDCVKEFTIEPQVTGKDNNDGTYDITVQYTLSSPVAIESLSFQGGATSGGKFKHKMGPTTGFTGQKDLNQNTVLTYEGALQACTPLVLSFTYTRNYDCATITDSEVTGDWKAIVNGVVVKELAPLTWNCRNEP